MLKLAVLSGMIFAGVAGSAAAKDYVALDACQIVDNGIRCRVTNIAEQVITGVAVQFELKDPNRQLPWANNRYTAPNPITGGLEPGESTTEFFISTDVPDRADRTKIAINIQRVVAYAASGNPISERAAEDPSPYSDLAAQISPCWSDSVSSVGRNVVVELQVEFGAGGRLIASSIGQLSAAGGKEIEAKIAFESGRRALLRCMGDGYKAGKSGKFVVTFDPMIGQILIREQ